MMNKVVTLAFGLVCCSSAAHAATQVWELDNAHTNVGFKVRHAMVSNVRGTFKTVQGTIKADDKDVVKSSADFTVDIKSIDTGSDKRDQHLKSPDFFNEAQFPTMTFKSAKIDKKKGGLRVHGFLTLHGQTKPLVLDIEGPSKAVRDPFGMTRVAVAAKGKINRKDYGLVWNQALEAGGVLVSENVDIEIDAEFVRKDSPTPNEPASASPIAGEPKPKTKE